MRALVSLKGCVITLEFSVPTIYERLSIVGLLNNYIFIIIKHMILYIFYFKDSVIRLYNQGKPGDTITIHQVIAYAYL